MKDISQGDIQNNLKLVVASTGEFKVENKNFVLKNNSFVVIGGPCRIESLEQMEASAKAIKANGLKFIRAGAFKPCTFPYASGGMGEGGLKILKEIADKYDLISVSEIMAVSQIDLGIKYVDVFQIGARNMQNYNLLEAIGKTGKPVILKRHPGSSLRDLLGAAEWLLANGCKYLMVCERGITVPYTHDVNARWLLDIQIVPAIKRITKIPIILDVSHSSGTRAFIPYLTTAVAGSGADGLMIETHPEPDKSQSDKDQIIDFESFKQLTEKVKKITNVLDKKVV
ncbi:MAG: N-acetylneuraminate synthase family protein [Patescibacteria group bacterium]